MHLLITNDDGIHAEGLWALYNFFEDRCRIDIVAPDRERSAVGHGITLHQPIRADKIRLNGKKWGYAVSGTPADCIKLGLLELLNQKPDLVVSGINPGANLGVNVNYSGTVAAAKEASLYGIPSIAVSVNSGQPRYYDHAARFVGHLAQRVFQEGLPFGTFLNVNIPDRPMNAVRGVRFSKQGTDFFKEHIEKKVDPRNRPYYWQGCESQPTYFDPEVDGAAICEDFISITPIKCDMTDYSMMDHLKLWDVWK